VALLRIGLKLVPAMLAGARKHFRIARSSGVVFRHFGQVTFAPSSHRSPVRVTGFSGTDGASSGSVRSFGSLGPQLAKLEFAEPGQREVEASEFKLAEFET